MRTLLTLLSLSLLLFVSCELPILTSITTPDAPDPLPIEQDTCTEFVEITEPAFITAYQPYFDFPFEEGFLIVGDDSTWVDNATMYDLSHLLDSMLRAWKPQYDYIVFSNPDGNFLCSFVVIGTNNISEFRQYVRVRYPVTETVWGTAGFGWLKQAFAFANVATYEQYLLAAKTLPSVDYFTFIGTHYDSLQYVDLSYVILGECKAGRLRADFRYMDYEMPDTLINQFVERGWQDVWH